MPHHNTTRETGPDLFSMQRKAQRLQDKVFELFLTRRQPMTADEVSSALGDRHLLTSVRRAMSDLKTDHRLVKTDEKVPGRHGRPNYKYRLA